MKKKHSASIESGYTARLDGWVGLGTIQMRTVKYVHGILDTVDHV